MSNFKTGLRKNLIKSLPEEDLQKWFDPLSIQLDSSGYIHISFPHQFFAAWFHANYKDLFESCLKNSLKRETLFIYNNPPGFSQPEQEKYVAEAQPVNTEKQSFANFLFNQKNEFPFFAASSFAKLQAKSPLLIIYAPGGCGKSHLLRAIYEEINNNDTKKTIYFANLIELGTKVTNNRTSIAKELQKINAADVILLDDVQFILNITGIYNLILNILDSVPERNKILALTFNCTPELCPSLDSGFKSRLEGGLLIEIKKPDIEIRRQYIKQQCKIMQLELAKNDVLELALNYTEFRQIKGALNKIAEFKSIYNNNLNNEPVVLNKILNRQDKERKSLDAEHIINCVARYLKVEAKEITGASRAQNVVFARQAAMYLCRTLLGLPLEAVGRSFGGKDHSSVLYSIKKIEKSIDKNKDVNNLMQILKNTCVSALPKK